MKEDTEFNGTILTSDGSGGSPSPLNQIPRPLLEYLLESSPSGVVIIDHNSKLLYLNPALANIFGYEKAEMLGKSLTMIMPPNMRSRHDTAVNTLRKNKTPSMNWEFTQLTGLHKSGDHLDLELSFAAFDDGDEMTFMGIIKDVTARKEAERQLASERARFEAFFEQSHEALLVHKTDGTIIEANSKAQALFGRSLEELKQMKAKDLHSPDHAAAPPKYELSFDEAFAFSSRMHHWSTGKEIPVEVQLQKIKVGDEALIIAALRDVSRVQRLTEQLQRSQQVELVGRLAAGISHDFNNLLTVIIHNAHELKDFSELTESDHQVVSDIITASEQASTLSSRLLGMARSSKSQRQSTSLNELIENIIRILNRIVGPNITIQLNLCADPTHIIVNSSQIQQVLTNLVLNARDAMPNGGMLTIQTEVRTEDASSNLWVSVTDTGVGMPPEIVSQIFEPLFTTKPDGMGTGLGLSSVQAVLEAHGASIEVESQEGVGTTFQICFPERLIAEDTSHVSQPQDQAGRKILVVEDMTPVRNTLVRLLKRKGLDVHSASNGLEAIETMNNHSAQPFDLIITDMMMPKMNGRVLSERVLETYPSTKIIVLSAYSADLMPDDDKGRISFLAKPIQPTKLYEAMKTLLGDTLFGDEP